MPDPVEIILPDADATLAFGARLSALNGLIFLRGELGAGKTTLVRGYLQALGHQGAVKSPTYTLIEPYDIGGRRILHLDIYRLADPEELELMGVRDELGQGHTLLVEWPERAGGYFGQPDIDIELSYQDHARRVRLQADDFNLQHTLHEVFSSM